MCVVCILVFVFEICEDRNGNLFAYLDDLLFCCRAVHIQADEAYFHPSLRVELCQLSSSRCLSRTKQANEENFERLLLNLDLLPFAAEESYQLLIDDIDELLFLCQSRGELLIHRPFLDAACEIKDQLDIDISLKKSSLDVLD